MVILTLIFSDWTVSNRTGSTAPLGNGSTRAVINSENEATSGGSIEQGFDAPVGELHVVSLQIREIGGGVQNHTFQVDVLDDRGAAVATETQTVPNNRSLNGNFTFTPTRTAPPCASPTRHRRAVDPLTVLSTIFRLWPWRSHRATTRFLAARALT